MPRQGVRSRTSSREIATTGQKRSSSDHTTRRKSSELRDMKEHSPRSKSPVFRILTERSHSSERQSTPLSASKSKEVFSKMFEEFVQHMATSRAREMSTNLRESRSGAERGESVPYIPLEEPFQTERKQHEVEQPTHKRSKVRFEDESSSTTMSPVPTEQCQDKTLLKTLIYALDKHLSSAGGCQLRERSYSRIYCRAEAHQSAPCVHVPSENWSPPPQPVPYWSAEPSPQQAIMPATNSWTNWSDPVQHREVAGYQDYTPNEDYLCHNCQDPVEQGFHGENLVMQAEPDNTHVYSNQPSCPGVMYSGMRLPKPSLRPSTVRTQSGCCHTFTPPMSEQDDISTTTVFQQRSDFCISTETSCAFRESFHDHNPTENKYTTTEGSPLSQDNCPFCASNTWTPQEESFCNHQPRDLTTAVVQVRKYVDSISDLTSNFFCCLGAASDSPTNRQPDKVAGEKDIPDNTGRVADPLPIREEDYL